MNSLAKSAIIECTRLGVAEWVVCPGARNAALLELLGNAQGIRLWTHFDERSAGFFALGRMQATERPVAIVTTSGTAVAELLPACIESWYQGRPLIIVSADREEEYRGSGAPQAIEQVGIFSHYVSYSLDLKEGDDSESFHPLKNWYKDSPIHINLCLPEPKLGEYAHTLLDLEPSQETPTTPFKENVGELAQFLKNDCWKGLVIIIGGLEPADQDPTLWLCESLGVPAWADATSGIRESLGRLSLTDIDSLLKKNPPPYVLRIGDIPTCRFWRDLENLPETKVFSITRTGLPGLAQRPSTVIKGSMERVVRALGDVFPIGDMIDILVPSRKKEGIIDELLHCYTESEPALIRTASLFASMSDLIYLGNSMPIREWNLFAQREIDTPNVRANRGANGIDGQIASFLGAGADVETAWGIFGDLTALYDANALAMHPQLPQGRRIIVVINNHGGRIFERLPKGSELSENLEKLLVQPHPWSMKPLAELWNAHYRAVHTSDDLDFEPEPGLTLLEIMPDATQTEQFWEVYSTK